MFYVKAVLIFSVCFVAQVPILRANVDGLQRDNTWAQYGTTIKLGSSHTLCLRFRIRVFRLLSALIYFFDVKDPDNEPVSFEVYFDKIRTKYGGYGQFYSLPYKLATSTWYHYCHIRDKPKGIGSVYLNGERIIKEKFKFRADNYTRKVFIGQDQFQAPYSFSGDLSQINVWDRPLTSDEIKTIAECTSVTEGNLLQWSGQWTLNEVDMSGFIPVSEFCEGDTGDTQVVPLPRMRYVDSVMTCTALGGVIRTSKTLEQVHSEMSHFEGREDCERQFAGSNDESLEGTWRDPFSKETHTIDELLFDSQPDGGSHQNCLRIYTTGFKDTDCKRGSCAACHVPTIETWTLRGICEEDERMNYMNLDPNPLLFRGYGEYTIENINGNWTWSDTVKSTVMAVLIYDKADTNYPMGRRWWELRTETCGLTPGSKIELTLSRCGKDQFTCSDGSCIPFASRCDLKFDCSDKTDERQCDIVNFPSDYRMNLPPRPQSNTALPIGLNISIDNLNVNTETMFLSVSYNLRITWFDNRLTYNNLKERKQLNALPMQQVERLWRPHLEYVNTIDTQQSSLDEHSVTTIIKQTELSKPDLSNPYEVEIFSGEGSPISSTRKYFTTYTCNFDLTLYPFDIQKCAMMIQILSTSNDYLIFSEIQSNIEYLGSKFLVEYAIGKIRMSVDNSTQYAEMKITVELIRRYGYAMLNIYVPSLTLLIISCVTLFFRPNIFEVRVMTALTSLLVLATLFTQVSSSLPKTSYFKMVDIWLLFCIVVIFIIIILHAFIDAFVDHDAPTSCSQTTDELKSKKLGLLIFFARLFTFSLFCIFNFFYWTALSIDSGLVYFY